MDAVIEKILRMSDKEKDLFFAKNTKIIPGAIVYLPKEDKIGEVLYRKFGRIFVRTVLNLHNDDEEVSNSINYYVESEIKSNRIKPFTKDDYKLLLQKSRERTVRDSLDKYIRKILNGVFTEERVEVDRSDNYLYITIHFPEIVVRNSLDITHTVRDLYLILTLKIPQKGNLVLYLRDFNAFRATYEPKEVYHQYMISHIRKSATGRIASSDDFCLGSSDLETFMRIRSNEGIRIDELLYLIALFKSFFEWESIDGVPFVHISDLKPFKVEEVDSIPKRLTEEDYITLLEDLILYPLNISFDFITSTQFTYSSDVRTQIEKKIEKLFGDKYKIDVYGDSEGKISLIKKEDVSFRYSVQGIYFKEQHIEPVIIESSESNISTEKRMFKELITNFLNSLNFDFTDEVIKIKLSQMGLNQ